MNIGLLTWPPEDKDDVPEMPTNWPWPHEFSRPRPPITFSGKHLLPPPPGTSKQPLNPSQIAGAEIRSKMSASWAIQCLHHLRLYYIDVKSSLWLDWALDKSDFQEIDIEELRDNLSRVWIRGAEVVNSAHQSIRLFRVDENSTGPISEDLAENIKILRNALIHLDEDSLHMDESSICDTTSTKSRALNKLANQRLSLAVDNTFTDFLLGNEGLELSEIFSSMKSLAIVSSRFKMEEDDSPPGFRGIFHN